MAADMLFNGLIRYVPGRMDRFEPDLAETIPEFITQGGKQIWNVRLKRGVFFHPGPQTPAYELTADDVIFSLTKAIDPGQSVQTSNLRGMSLRKTGSHALDIILDKPVSPLFLLPLLANHKGGCIISRRAYLSMGSAAFGKHPVGTGPFQFGELVPGKKMVLPANPRYFRGRPQLGGVELHFIPDNQRRKTAFLDGALDGIIGSAGAGWLDSAENTEGVLVDIFGPGYTGLFHLNTRIKPLNDIRIRQAIFCALDRNSFVRETNSRLIEPILAPMPKVAYPMGMTNEQVRALGLEQKLDLVRARRLLASAGYPQGFELSVFVSEKRVYRESYENLKRQLSRVGIRLKLKVIPHSEMHRRVRQDESPIVLYFTNRFNPDSYLRGFFHSDSIVRAGRFPRTNFAHYDRVDKLLDDAFLEVDPKYQAQLWSQVQIRILFDAVAYPLYCVENCILRWDRLDYGHDLVNTRFGYPQFTEKTRIGLA